MRVLFRSEDGRSGHMSLGLGHSIDDLLVSACEQLALPLRRRQEIVKLSVIIVDNDEDLSESSSLESERDYSMLILPESMQLRRDTRVLRWIKDHLSASANNDDTKDSNKSMSFLIIRIDNCQTLSDVRTWIIQNEWTQKVTNPYKLALKRESQMKIKSSSSSSSSSISKADRSIKYLKLTQILMRVCENLVDSDQSGMSLSKFGSVNYSGIIRTLSEDWSDDTAECIDTIMHKLGFNFNPSNKRMELSSLFLITNQQENPEQVAPNAHLKSRQSECMSMEQSLRCMKHLLRCIYRDFPQFRPVGYDIDSLHHNHLNQMSDDTSINETEDSGHIKNETSSSLRDEQMLLIAQQQQSSSESFSSGSSRFSSLKKDSPFEDAAPSILRRRKIKTLESEEQRQSELKKGGKHSSSLVSQPLKAKVVQIWHQLADFVFPLILVTVLFYGLFSLILRRLR